MNGRIRMRTVAIVATVMAGLVTNTVKPLWAYTPQSPEVQSLVSQGIAFIEQDFGKNLHDSELGAVCICALACYSHTGKADHPLVKQAIEAIRKEIQAGMPHQSHGNYSLGIALILLGSVDPAGYSRETQALLDEVYKRQMSGGGWSYPQYATGDTSQTQFACLGMWMAHRQGINVPMPPVERVTNWLIRTQAPDGAFGYQGKDPGNFNRVAQERTTPSMGVAGTGTLYVCGELLGFIEPPAEKAPVGLPVALKQAPRKRKKDATPSAVDASKWREAITAGDNWCNRNAGTTNLMGGAVTQQSYYMYTVERYWAFRDLTSRNPDAEPGWYNAGVEYLRKTVDKNGSWTTGNGASIDTAFSVLFLLRSSKKTIQRIVEEAGALRAGKGLPDDLTDIRQSKDGKVVSTKETPVVEDVLNMLEDQNTPLGEFLNGVPDQLELAADPAQRAKQIARLRRMAISGPFQSRLTAVKTLARIRDLDNAPALIFAITDPDTRIARAAIDGLRFISRRIDAPMIPEEATPPQKEEYAATWKAWYLAIRPDGTLIE